MLQQFEAHIQTLTAANQSKQSDIDAMQSEIDSMQSEIDFLIQSKQSEIESLRAEVERLFKVPHNRHTDNTAIPASLTYKTRYTGKCLCVAT